MPNKYGAGGGTLIRAIAFQCQTDVGFTTPRHALVFFLATFVAFLCTGVATAAPTFGLDTGAGAQKYTLDCGSVLCRPGDKKAHTVAITPAAETLDDVAAEVKRLRREANADFDLIVYPAGGPRNAQTRRTFAKRIAVRSEALERVALAPDWEARPHPIDGWTILYFPSAAEALTSYLSLVEKLGRDSVLPLLRRQASKRQTPTDPRYAYSATNRSYQWHLRNTGQNGGVAGIDANVSGLWGNYRGTGVVIGIVDDGLENAHPDLSANADTAIDRNWNAGSRNDAKPLDPNDDHGTSCAGVSAARDGNGIGGVGAAPRAGLVGLRLIAGEVDDSDEAEALSWQRDTIDIYNNSWGPSDLTTEFERPGPLLVAAFEAGVTSGRGGLGSIYPWAGGNGHLDGDRSSYDGYANRPETIAVGAIDDDGNRAEYSERGANLVISAPSDGSLDDQAITTTTVVANGSYTDNFGGTSSATPLVSGVIALMLEANPQLNWRDVQEILIRSARQLDANDRGWVTNSAGLTFHHDYGAGMVDAAAAVALAQGWASVGTRLSETQASGALNESVLVGGLASYEINFAPSARMIAEHVVLTVQLDGANVGDLDVRLISPLGVTSQLVVPHTSPSDSIDNWDFMTVHNWGTDPAGTWRVEVRRSNGAGPAATLSRADLTVYGRSDESEPSAPEVVSPSTVSVVTGQPFSYRIIATQSPEFYSALALPAWATVDAAGLVTGVAPAVGTYTFTARATNALGAGDKLITIEVVAPPGQTLATALDIAGAPVTTAGASEWRVIDARAQVGGAAVTTGTTDDSQSNSLTTTMTLAEPSTLSFWWQVESEQGYDEFSFAINGQPYAAISGAMNWREQQAELQAGTYELTWTFARDGSSGFGENVASLDSISVEPFESSSPPSRRAHSLATGSDLELTASSSTWLVFPRLAGEPRHVRSPPTGNNSSQTLTTTVVGPGQLSFRWAISSEDSYDTGSFAVDGTTVATLTSDTEFESFSRSIPAGRHTLSWRYAKDSGASEGADALMLAELRFTRPSSYEAYADVIFSGSQVYDINRSSMFADPDSDDIPNVVEWFTGTDLLVRTEANPLRFSPRFVEVTTRQVAVGIEWEIQRSTTLAEDSWSSASPVALLPPTNGFRDASFSRPTEPLPEQEYFRLHVSPVR